MVSVFCSFTSEARIQCNKEGFDPGPAFLRSHRPTSSSGSVCHPCVLLQSPVLILLCPMPWGQQDPSSVDFIFTLGGREYRGELVPVHRYSADQMYLPYVIATVMVLSFSEQHDFNRVGLEGHAVPSLPEVQECHHVGRPGLIKYYFLFQPR